MKSKIRTFSMAVLRSSITTDEKEERRPFDMGKKIMKRIAALLDAGKPEKFIAGVENLLRTAKGQALKNILTLNLTAGYMDAKQYHTAVDLLESLSGKRLSGSAAKMVLRLDLCMGNFYTAFFTNAP